MPLTQRDKGSFFSFLKAIMGLPWATGLIL
jgi:hypothetical protein